MPTNLVSIDTVHGQLRAYTSIEGNAPKCVQIVDLVNYDRATFPWDVDALEAFRRNPADFVSDSGDAAA